MKTSEANSKKIHKKWLDVLGHDSLLDKLYQLISNESFPAVCLLEGRSGIGKSMLAGKLAARHYCEQGEACGKCSGCLWVLSGNHNDIMFFEDDDVSLKIADAKKFQEHLEIEPEKSHDINSKTRAARIVVVPDVDRFNEISINRLLKILEEPPENARIILTTSKAQSLMDTFLSRCVRFKISPPEIEDSIKIIQNNLTEDKVSKIPVELLVRYLKRLGLSPGKVLAKLESDNLSDSLSNQCSDLLLKGKTVEIVKLAQTISSEKQGEAIQIAEEIELALNQLYRGFVNSGKRSESLLDPLKVQQRRQVIKEIKWYAGSKKIKLNTQLAAEAIGLANIGISRFN